MTAGFSSVLLALAWLAFAAIHSLLASFAVKTRVTQRWPAAAPWYRLAFNSFSLITVLPILWFSYALDGPLLWQWSGAWRWVSHALTLTAVAGFAAAARGYDMDTFLGLRQVREQDRQPDGHESFRISAFHRCVRHPWYCCGLLLVWSGDKNLPLLVSAVAITAYFIVGSRLEERKLIALHGAAYRRYMARVPGLLPLPWKCLSAKEAGEISG
jgi:protein-S-isoprenylcysteine O-methyltransferase Ste14